MGETKMERLSKWINSMDSAGAYGDHLAYVIARTEIGIFSLE